MPLTLKPHEYQTVRGRAVLKAVRPYIRLKSGDGPPIFIQGGKFYSEGGDEFPEGKLPGWVQEEIEKLTEKAKQEVGLLKKK